MNTIEIFAHNLRNQIDLKKKSQADIARHLNVTTATVSRWANGLSMPRHAMMDKLCAYLNCSTEDLTADHTKTAVMLPEDIIADELRDNPQLFQLFVMCLKASADDIQHCIDYLKK